MDEKSRWTAVIIRAIAAGLAIAALICIPSYVSAWNIPTHMITGAIAYQTLALVDPSKVKGISLLLERHPWYAEHWRRRIENRSGEKRIELLFMLAARWADDVRKRDRAQDRPQWHYINFPFKPEGESVDIKPPAPVNILTALAENQRFLRSEAPAEQRAIALAWLFHLVGDVHQPLHTAQMFTREYPDGDRGGNEICARVEPDRPAVDLHRLWDGLITSTSNIRRLRQIAAELRSKLPKLSLTELASGEAEIWAKESYEIAVKIAYQKGKLRGTPRGEGRDCRDIDATVLPHNYAAISRRAVDRRVVLTGYRVADLLSRLRELTNRRLS